MTRHFTRRQFLQSAAGLTILSSAVRGARPAPSAPASGKPFTFILLGDLHFDRPEHHDMAWVQKEKPNDVRQIEGYCRNTRDVTPRLFSTLRDVLADLRQAAATPPAFVLQVGDLVEGLCGSEELAARQDREVVEFIRSAQLGAPFLFTKGNHDITGPGAAAAFARVFHPFLTAEARAIAADAPEVANGNYTVDCGNAQFVFFDSYEAAKSLAWLEGVAAKRTAEHFFLILHPPVVPYGARSTWHIFSSAKEKVRREKLLSLLGDQHAIVLGGHIHRYNALGRKAGRGCFAQFALSSVLSAPTASPKEVLTGLSTYTPDQVKVEPAFSPANEAERRAVYEAERPFVTAFDYADLPGYAVITVDGARVEAAMYAGATRELWRKVDLAALARG